MNRTDFLLPADDDKQRVYFEYTLYGKTHKLQAEYDDCDGWHQIVDDLVRTLEAAYGYTFDLEHDLGTYYPGKSNGHQ